MEQTIIQYESIIKKCEDIFAKKLKDYGTAWRILRVSSLTDQIFIKAQRIRSIDQKGTQKIMEDISRQFNPIYERRLRIYQIEDADFSYLPQGAFSFVFSWYHFEFLPYDIIDRYLAGVFNMLRPGGHAFLSYANCLMEKSAEQFEKHYYCYMTTKLMEGLATKNGFDIVEQEDFQSRMSWVILKKPGRFTKGIKRVPSIGYMRDYRTDKIPGQI